MMISDFKLLPEYGGDTPILVIGFLRSQTLMKLLDSLPFSQKKIFISIDGPRDLYEEPLVEASIFVAKEFENRRPGTQVAMKINTTNMGCKYGIFSAINWAFENEEKLIILEDDIVITEEFLKFADWGLKRFQNSKKIWQINGWSPLNIEHKISRPYLSIFTYGWGWATWKDRWHRIDLELEEYDLTDIRGMQELNRRKLSSSFNKWWMDKLTRCKEGLDTWDYQWNFTMWRQAGYALSPGVSLTGNIGFDELATHTKIPHNNRDKMPVSTHKTLVSESFEPMINVKADKICANKNMGINRPILVRMQDRLKRHLVKRGTGY